MAHRLELEWKPSQMKRQACQIPLLQVIAGEVLPLGLAIACQAQISEMCQLSTKLLAWQICTWCSIYTLKKIFWQFPSL